MTDNLEPEITINEFLCKFHFPIVGFCEHSKKEETIGTCTLINIDGIIFLVTASHVMNKRHKVKNKELWIWNYSDGSKITITEDIIENPEVDIPHWNDIAIVEINISEYETFNNDQFFKKCFLSLDHMVHDINYLIKNEEELSYLIAGYPSSKNKISRNSYKKPQQFHYLTHSISNKFSGVDLTPDSQLTISLKWDNSDVNEKGQNLPQPQGMSGGGIWLLSNKAEFNPRLIAIPVAYIKLEKRIIGIKIALVLAMIKFFYPDVNLDVNKVPIVIFGSVDNLKMAIPLTTIV